MRNRARIFLGLLVLLLLCSSARGDGGAPRGGRIFLWKVRSGNAVSYLLGSIHLMKKEMYPLDRRIEEAFAGSSVLVVETDTERGDKEKLDTFILGNAFYPDGDALEKHISPETYALVRGKIRPLGLTGADRMKPWALALTATTVEYLKMGLDPDYGIDRHFLEEADGKKIVELEDHEQVIRLLEGLPDGIQDLFLFYTLKDLETIGKEVDAVISYWSAGDVKGMEEVVYRSRVEYPKLLPVYEILVSGRNRSMADKIDGLLRTGESCFVVVGAGHLVGKDGILERLRRKGYAVEQQ